MKTLRGENLDLNAGSLVKIPFAIVALDKLTKKVSAKSNHIGIERRKV